MIVTAAVHGADAGSADRVEVGEALTPVAAHPATLFALAGAPHADDIRESVERVRPSRTRRAPPRRRGPEPHRLALPAPAPPRLPIDDRRVVLDGVIAAPRVIVAAARRTHTPSTGTIPQGQAFPLACTPPPPTQTPQRQNDPQRGGGSSPSPPPPPPGAPPPPKNPRPHVGSLGAEM